MSEWFVQSLEAHPEWVSATCWHPYKGDLLEMKWEGRPNSIPGLSELLKQVGECIAAWMPAISMETDERTT